MGHGEARLGNPACLRRASLPWSFMVFSGHVVMSIYEYLGGWIVFPGPFSRSRFASISVFAHLSRAGGGRRQG